MWKTDIKRLREEELGWDRLEKLEFERKDSLDREILEKNRMLEKEKDDLDLGWLIDSQGGKIDKAVSNSPQPKKVKRQ